MEHVIGSELDVVHWAQGAPLLDIGQMRRQAAWLTVPVQDRGYGGRVCVHLSVNARTFESLVVVARVMSTWTQRGVGEIVADTVDEAGGGEEAEQAEDIALGMQTLTARMWCRSSGCTSTRSCIHTRMI